MTKENDRANTPATCLINQNPTHIASAPPIEKPPVV